MKISPLNYNRVNCYTNITSDRHVCKFPVQNSLTPDVFWASFKRKSKQALSDNMADERTEQIRKELCHEIKNQVQAAFLNRILENDKLRDLEVWPSFWHNIMKCVSTKEQANYRMELLRTMLNYPEILSNKVSLEYMSLMVGDVTNVSQFQLVKKVFDSEGISKDKPNSFRAAYYVIQNANSPKKIELAQKILKHKYDNPDVFEKTAYLIFGEAQNEKKLDIILSFFGELDENYSVMAVKLQQDKGVEIVASKDFKDEKNESGDVTVKKILDKEGVTKTIRIELDSPNPKKENGEAGLSGKKYTLSRYTKSNRTVYTKKPSDGNPILQIEVVYDTNGQPDYALTTAKSKDLNGVFEVTKYNFQDHPENLNVLKAIHEGKIEGQKLSSVTRRGNTVYYDENLDQGDCETTRHYFETKDDEGNIVETNYSYRIEGNDTNFNNERSWRKNKNGTTETFVNGRKYTTSFDSDEMIATIVDDNGKMTKINFKKKLKAIKRVPSINLKRPKEEFTELEQKRFFEFLKTVPADVLLKLDKNIKKILALSGYKESGWIKYYKLIQCSTDLGTFLHELGHSINDKKCLCGISKNQELIKLYKEEMDVFRNKYAGDNQNIINYLGYQSNANSGGLSEFVAETYMLLHSCRNSNEELQQRSQYLVYYFPKTISKIAQLIKEQEEK